MQPIPAPKKHIALALGSNLGDRLKILRAAVEKLAPYVKIEKISPVYETLAAYVTDQPAFLNAVIVGATAFEPLALLGSLKKLETQLGRQPSFRYGPRAIDIDLLFYGDNILASAELTLPHPRLQEREFVLRPLADIAPGWQHPQTKLTAAAMLERLPEQAAIRLPDML